MRVAVLLAVAGCRSILGIEEPIDPPSGEDAAAVDSHRSDAHPQPDATGCPITFQPLANSGPRGHRYRLIAMQASWTTQRDACAQMQAFLAFPDGATSADAQLELAAITDLAGLDVWLGVNDLAVEGMHENALGQPISAVTASLVAAPNTNQDDCIYSRPGLMELRHGTCTSIAYAVCECVP